MVLTTAEQAMIHGRVRVLLALLDILAARLQDFPAAVGEGDQSPVRPMRPRWGA
ncbi:MAG TPA: hypothetical protein VHN80_31305 [Kineosporiaceae bacterium]|nr:hypothetical protein [Kineosporiaceae bacterium]